jgi:ABC-type antimicrobial peptide transport system permease subunit
VTNQTVNNYFKALVSIFCGYLLGKGLSIALINEGTIFVKSTKLSFTSIQTLYEFVVVGLVSILAIIFSKRLKRRLENRDVYLHESIMGFSFAFFLMVPIFGNFNFGPAAVLLSLIFGLLASVIMALVIKKRRM